MKTAFWQMWFIMTLEIQATLPLKAHFAYIYMYIVACHIIIKKYFIPLFLIGSASHILVSNWECVIRRHIAIVYRRNSYCQFRSLKTWHHPEAYSKQYKYTNSDKKNLFEMAILCDWSPSKQDEKVFWPTSASAKPSETWVVHLNLRKSGDTKNFQLQHIPQLV